MDTLYLLNLYTCDLRMWCMLYRFTYIPVKHTMMRNSMIFSRVWKSSYFSGKLNSSAPQYAWSQSKPGWDFILDKQCIMSFQFPKIWFHLCEQVLFCSETCQRVAGVYHDTECGYMSIFPGMGTLAPVLRLIQNTEN